MSQSDHRSVMETLLADVEQLASVGGWSWDLTTREATWSDELYRIQGLEPQSVPASLELLLSSVPEGDPGYVVALLESVVERPDSLPPDALSFEHGALWTWDDDRGRLVCRAFWAFPTTTSGTEPSAFELATRAMEFAPGEGAPGRAWAHGRPAIVGEIAADPSFGRPDAARALGLTSGVAVVKRRAVRFHIRRSPARETPPRGGVCFCSRAIVTSLAPGPKSWRADGCVRLGQPMEAVRNTGMPKSFARAISQRGQGRLRWWWPSTTQTGRHCRAPQRQRDVPHRRCATRR